MLTNPAFVPFPAGRPAGPPAGPAGNAALAALADASRTAPSDMSRAVWLVSTGGAIASPAGLLGCAAACVKSGRALELRPDVFAHLVLDAVGRLARRFPATLTQDWPDRVLRAEDASRPVANIPSAGWLEAMVEPPDRLGASCRRIFDLAGGLVPSGPLNTNPLAGAFASACEIASIAAIGLCDARDATDRAAAAWYPPGAETYGLRAIARSGSPDEWMRLDALCAAAEELFTLPPAGGMAGAPMAGAPMAGAPMAGAPMAGAPMAGAPMAGAPMAGAPMAGAASVRQLRAAIRSMRDGLFGGLETEAVDRAFVPRAFRLDSSGELATGWLVDLCADALGVSPVVPGARAPIRRWLGFDAAPGVAPSHLRTEAFVRGSGGFVRLSEFPAATVLPVYTERQMRRFVVVCGLLGSEALGEVLAPRYAIRTYETTDTQLFGRLPGSVRR